MKPLFVTNLVGQRVRLNPMNVIGWVPAEAPLGDGKVIMGSALAVTDGARVVRESPEQIDFLFEQATDGWMRPLITRRELEKFVDGMRADREAEDAATDEVNAAAAVQVTCSRCNRSGLDRDALVSTCVISGSCPMIREALRPPPPPPPSREPP